VTGAPANYRDPLTGQPFANKEAFKIIREKYFQKEEEKLFLRM
jgi:vacuolar protein sorting-associated protein 72